MTLCDNSRILCLTDTTVVVDSNDKNERMLTMKITFNSKEEFKELQSMIAKLEEASMMLLGEERGISIVFDEITEDNQNGLFLPYTIYSCCEEPIKYASLNIAR